MKKTKRFKPEKRVRKMVGKAMRAIREGRDVRFDIRNLKVIVSDREPVR